jgi:predicted dehydrogenase
MITAIIVGAGHRALGYAELAKIYPDQLKIVGVADPLADRRKYCREYFGFSEDMCFESAEELAKHGKLADAVINGTMDAEHIPTSIPLLEAGYDILLEKPFATDMVDWEKLDEAVRRTNRKVMICHVLRYAPFYVEIKKAILAGKIGKIMHIHTAEHVSYHHFTSCYVRGKWNNTKTCGASVLLAKCCHDIDLITWFMSGVKPVSVASMGGLHYFNKENAPANSGTHCMLDCPLEKTCDYSVRRLHLDHPIPWNAYVWPTHAYNPELNNHEQRLKEIMQKDFPHSRCVWKCDNNQVDRQSVIINFADGTVATHNMTTNTARPLRKIHIIGTDGEIEGVFDENKFVIRHRDLCPENTFCGNIEELVDITAGGDTTGATGDHGGGDLRLAMDFVNLVSGKPTGISCTTLADSLNGHKLVFAADTAMIQKNRVMFDDFTARDEKRY